jgi:fructose-bisphosphate aldolase class 1
MGKQEPATIVTALIAPGKDLLATDESPRACNKRSQAVGIAPTKENRRDPRN